MKTSVLLLVLGVVCASCAAPGTESEIASTTCTGGKCDLADELSEEIDSLVQKARAVDREDFIHVATGFATDELNDELAFGGISADIHAPEHYALHEDAEGDLTLNDLDELVTGMTHRYGERELSTEVNAVRQRWLEESDDVVFTESAFELDADFDHGWSFDTGGLIDDEDALVTIGFAAGVGLQTRLIAPFDDEIHATGRSMREALQSTRNFIEPRSMEDVRAMKPGELWGRRGRGYVGLNFGYGMPTLVVNPLEWLTYRLILSAAVRTRLEGLMDIQVVRMDGDQVVVDVGTQIADIDYFRVALRDGWGVEGLIDTEIEMAGIDIDLGRLIERALEKFLERKLNFLEARWENTARSSRMTIARFRFHLDAADAEVEQALAQALKGDIRYAQALANAGSAGVDAELDFARVGASVVRHVGIYLFGMDFFAETDLRQGQVTWQTPGGARSLLFNSLRQQRGRFFSEHGYTRVGLSGMTWSPGDRGTARGEANLFLQLAVGDDYMNHDKLLDQVDPFILAVAGPDAFAELAGPGNRIASAVDSWCDQGDGFDDCHVRITQGNPDVPPMVSRDSARELAHSRDSREQDRGHALLMAWAAHDIAVARRDAMEAFQGHLGGMDEQMRALVVEMADLRLKMQTASEFVGSLTGPKTSLLVDYRLDDAALDYLMLANDGQDLRRALGRTLGVVEVDRDHIDGIYIDPYDPDRDEDVDEEIDEELFDDEWNQVRIQRMVDAWNEARTEYSRYSQVAGQQYVVWDDYERGVEAGRLEVGDGVMAIHFPVDHENQPVYERAALTSLATQRARVAWQLWDVLYDQADDRTEERASRSPHQDTQQIGLNDVGRQGEQTVGYSLLSMVPHHMLDMRVELRVRTRDTWVTDRPQYRAVGLVDFDLSARGSGVAPLEAGMFDIDDLIFKE